MAVKKQCTWEGIQYESIEALTEALADTDRKPVKSTVREWINKGYTCEADLEARQPKRATFRFKGEKFTSLTDLRILMVKHLKTVKRKPRTRAGIGKKNGWMWNGHHEPTLRRLSEVVDIPMATLRDRMDKGWRCDADVGRKYYN